jgi:hypothetical protein
MFALSVPVAVTPVGGSDIVTAIQSAIDTISPYVLPAAAIGLGIAVIVWGTGFLWKLVKKLAH